MWYYGALINHALLSFLTESNDIEIASSPDEKRVAIAVFIAGSKAPEEVREKVISDIASAVVKAMQ